MQYGSLWRALAAGVVSRNEMVDKVACFIGIAWRFGAALSVFTGTHLTQKARLGNRAVRIKDGRSNILFWGYKCGSGNTKWGQLQATPFRFVSRNAASLNPQPPLVPWSWKGRAIPLLPLWAVRPVQSLSACTRVTFSFTFASLKFKGNQHGIINLNYRNGIILYNLTHNSCI